MLKLREDPVEPLDNKPEGPTRRAVEFALMEMGKQGPEALSHAARALKKRWGIWHGDVPIAPIKAIGESRRRIAGQPLLMDRNRRCC